MGKTIQMNGKYERASMWEMIRYGFGGIGSNIAYMFVLFYAATFFTDYLGISPLAMGTLLMVPRLIDAFTDPLMGMIGDRTRSRIGKFRPYVIFGAPVLALSMTLMFIDWGLTGTSLLVLCYILYIIYSLSSTVVNIPYHSLTPMMTEDPNQRTTVSIIKQLMGFIGIIPVMAVFPQLLKMYPDNPSIFAYFAGVLGIMLTLAFWICANGAKRKDTEARIEKYEGTAGEREHLPFISQMQVIYKNKALLLLMVAFGTDMIAMGATSGIGIYYFRDVVGNVGLASIAGMLPMLAGLPILFFLPLLSKKFGKKKLFIFGSSTQMLVAISLFFIPPSMTNLIILQAALAGLFMPFTGVLGWAMAADCVEYGEWKTGINGAGTVTSQITFVNKFGNALGGFLLGWLLSVAGYNAALEVQTSGTLNMIIVIKSILPALGFLCSIVAMSFYPITEAFFDKMVKENEARRKTQHS